jgi:transcription termination/antitermination protein NusG
MSISEDAKWYVLHTYSTYETLVKQSLENIIKQNALEEYILEINIPMVQETVEKDGKKKTKQVKKFPGYIFLKMVMTDQLWYYVTNTRGVTGFVGPGGKPVPLTDDETRKMGLEEILAEDFHIKVGDEVKIISGILEGISGVVQSINIEKEKVKVIANMMGNKTYVDLGFNQVEKIIAQK